MAQIQIAKNSTKKQVIVRFAALDTGYPYEGVSASTEGLELWYRREGGLRTPITPVDLTSATDDWTPGGLITIDNGYYRLDIPNEAIATGSDTVQIGGGADNLVMIGVNIYLTNAEGGTSDPDPEVVNPEIVDCQILLPEAEASTREGCPILTKRRHVPVAKGLCGDVMWIMRKPDGIPVNFTSCLGAGSLSESASLSMFDDIDVVVRFQGCDRGDILAEVDGEVLDSDHGIIQFPLPTAICQNTGIYQFQAALMKGDSPTFIDGGLISVEHGMWGNTGSMDGPPTIQEIRFAIMDRAVENTLLQAVEFSDADILEAVRWPVQNFNEITPDLGFQYCCNNFPFRYYWIQAIVGRLLMAAVHHYMRNKMLASSGGLNVDDKNRDTDYLRLCKMYQDEWMEWAQTKKIEMNASLAYGDITSRYGGYTGYEF